MKTNILYIGLSMMLSACSHSQKEPENPLHCLQDIVPEYLFPNSKNKITYIHNEVYDSLFVYSKDAKITSDSGVTWVVPNAEIGRAKLHFVGKKGRKIVAEIKQEIPLSPVPIPQIVSRINGQIVDIDSLSIREEAVGTRFYVQLKADFIFASRCPLDTRYEIGEINVILENILKEKHIMGTGNLKGRDASGLLNLPIPSAFFRPVNEALYYELGAVYRINYEGKKEIVTQINPNTLMLRKEKVLF